MKPKLEIYKESVLLVEEEEGKMDKTQNKNLNKEVREGGLSKK